MTILCTAPGRYGDIIWGLPTCRALAYASGEPVDLLLSEKYRSLLPLLQQQAYLRGVLIDLRWDVQETAPMTPRIPPRLPSGYGRVIHLGYRDWPRLPLAQETYDSAQAQWGGPLPPLDLETPWITVEGPGDPTEIVVGFSDEWFELKFGIVELLERCHLAPLVPYYGKGSRWDREGWGRRATWEEAARAFRNADLFLGCCSALHVLAVALGKPVLLMEPNEMRWQDIFYPLGKTGRVKLILGNDGRPTFHAPHVIDAVREALR